MKNYALTGGIGSGKSKALEIFDNLGAFVLDTDTITHDLYDNDINLQKKLSSSFGDVVTAGKIDRNKLAKIVFDNQTKLTQLNQIVHPIIKQKMLSLMQKNKINIVAIPLLYELQWQKLFTATIAVWCEMKIKNLRLKSRGWVQSQIDKRISTQINQDIKLKQADYALINSGDIPSLEMQCSSLWKKITQGNI